jgi:sRNA-binding regulator protein Hfq
MKKLSDGELISQLTERYGEMVDLKTLSKIIGYKTVDALKYAIRKNQFEVTTFFIEGRKGRFAMIRDVASWMIECKTKNNQSTYANNLNKDKCHDT